MSCAPHRAGRQGKREPCVNEVETGEKRGWEGGGRETERNGDGKWGKGRGMWEKRGCKVGKNES